MQTLWLSSTKSLRKLVGVLGMSLPVLLFVFLLMDQGPGLPLESISHYYYTRVASVFTSILSILAVFLIIYTEKDFIDFIISFIAGIAILLVVLLPTNNLSPICCDNTMKYAVTHLQDEPFRIGLHYVSAAIFLGCLAYMSIFLFTKSDLEPKFRGREKIIRNRIYRVCGALMILAMLVIFLGFLDIIPIEIYEKYKLTYCMETLAVESFGFAWLVKGETLFKDRPNTEPIVMS